MAAIPAGNPARTDRLNALRLAPKVSVLIIGGGSNGVGLLRELALQGVDAVLVERGDYCSGTSAASTRIIHGGLRYLENGEFRLVREALRERNLLLQTAPHYVKPLAVTIPIFSRIKGMWHAALKFLGLPSKPGDRGALILQAGLTLYDVFAGLGRAMPNHVFTSRRLALHLRPQINPRIVCTATYYDARIAYPERLCLELTQDAAAISPDARAFNYVSAVGAAGDTVTLRDELTGETFTVQPRFVVNAAGAWIDLANRALQRDTHLIGGTKGSHLVIDNADLWRATRGEMLYFANTDGRVCIFYPFFDKVIVGSTDIPADDPDAAVCDADETAYLIESVRQVFPKITIDRSQIVFTYCGVRPLPATKSVTTGQISRDHSYPVTPPGDGVNFPIYNLVGGKWTTFRAFSEQVADALLRDLGVSRRADSVGLAIGGGRGYPRTPRARADWIAVCARQTQLPAERVTALLDRYGTQAEDISVYLAAGADRPLTHHPAYSVREIQFIAEREQVAHLDDVILRRTLIGMLGETTHVLMDEIAHIIAPVLGWTDEQRSGEVTRMRDMLRVRHSAALA